MTDTPAETPETLAMEAASADFEHRYHHYRGNRIPWYVRLIWLGFWVMATYYVVQYLFPALQVEMTSPP
jgi:hypothetical protein